MTTPNTKKSKLYAWLALPLTVIMFFAFVEKVPATNQELKTQNKPADQHFTKEDIEKIKSDDPFAEYQEILSKYSNLLNEKKYDEFNRKISDEDKKRLNELSALLTSEQKERLPVFSLKGESDESNSKKENYLIGVNKNLKTDNDTIKPKKDVAQTIKQGFPPPAPSEVTPAEHPAGLHGFRTLFADAFNVAKMDKLEGLVKSTLYFDVDDKGNVSNFRAEGENNDFNAEAVRTLKQVNGNTVWKPATKDGKPVAYIFKLPLTMHFEKNPMPANKK